MIPIYWIISGDFDENNVVDLMTMRKTRVADFTFFQFMCGSFFTASFPSSSFDSVNNQIKIISLFSLQLFITFFFHSHFFFLFPYASIQSPPLNMYQLWLLLPFPEFFIFNHWIILWSSFSTNYSPCLALFVCLNLFLTVILFTKLMIF